MDFAYYEPTNRIRNTGLLVSVAKPTSTGGSQPVTPGGAQKP
jgi:hypothetical protein